MEHRFGFKDLILFALLAVVIILVALEMVRADRQWDLLERINANLSEQNKTLIQLSDALKRGEGGGARFSVREREEGDEGQAASGARSVSGAQSDSQTFARVLAPRDNKDFAFGGWFVDSFRNTVDKITPLVPTDAYAGAIGAYVLESLIVRDPETLDWKPWIAKDWQVSKDGLTITFDLRDGVTFSDGHPLTADDVVYTYNLIMNPKINDPQLRSYYENVASAQAVSPLQVVFHMKRPYFQSLSITGGMPILAKHFYEKFTPEEFNQKPGLLFGSGPYELTVPPAQWTPGQGTIELKRNERYWGPRPTFDRLVWRVIPDPTAQLTSFRNGEIDDYGIPPQKFPTLSKDANLLAKANLHEYMSIDDGYRYIGWNERRGGKPTIFADQRVRLALTLLTPRQRMAKQLMSGLATVATGPFNPLGPQDDPKVKPWPFDPDKAKALLAAAGWKDRNGDGVLDNAQGRALRFKLTYPAQSENYQQMAFYLKDAYARAGIVLEPDPTEWNTMIQMIKSRDFDALTLGWTGSVEGDPKQIFHSDSIAAGGSNYVSYSNPKLDALIDQARQTMDEDKRMALWHQVHDILHHDQPYTFLFFTKNVVFIDKRIHNVQVTKTGLNAKTEMYVPTDLQRRGR